MLVCYFVPFIVSNLYLLFRDWNGHNSVTVQNRTHVYMNFFDHKDLGNHLLQLCPKVVKHPIYIYIYIYKLKWSRYRPGVAQRVGRGIALLFHDRSTRRCEWLAARPGCTLPLGRTRYPFYRMLGGLQGRSGRAEHLVPTGIRSRTFQPVVSRYTDWATGPTKLKVPSRNFARTLRCTIYCVTSMLNQVSTVLCYVRREPGSILRLERQDPNRDFDILSLKPSNGCQYSAFQKCQHHSRPWFLIHNSCCSVLRF